MTEVDVEVDVSAKRFMLQVGGRHQASDLEGIGLLDGRVRLSTVLQARARDQAALQGLLRRINDLGLDLVQFHESREQVSEEREPDPHRSRPSPRVFVVTVAGPMGDLAAAALADYIEVVSVSARYDFTDTVLMGEVLTRVLARGAVLEHAAELPASESMSLTLHASNEDV
jgi:hypothetical protein